MRTWLSLFLALLFAIKLEAQQLPDSLEAAVAQARESSPQVQTVRAKFATLEAELAMVQQQVATKIGELWEQIQQHQLAVHQAERMLATAEQQNDADARIAAEQTLIVARTRLERLHSELRIAVGNRRHRATATSASEPKAERSGMQSEKEKALATLLANKVDADFTEAALTDVLGFFNEQCKAALHLQPEFRGDVVTLRLKGQTLLGALQAIEDLFPDREFFVREYGLLLYNRDQGRDLRGFLPLSEFVKQQQ